MKKRISKSELKKEQQKKKIKNQHKQKTLAANPAPHIIAFKPTKLLVPALLTGLLLFSFFRLPTPAEPASAIYENASLKEISLARQTLAAAEKPVVTTTPAELAKIKKVATLNKQITSITKNTPMERMAAEIATKSRATAAYLVGIAMKESKFGIYSPKKNGADCFNYWGYRGKENTTASGYSCFNSPSHALSVVGGRIDSMLKGGTRSPAQMVSWKCGSSCASFPPADVAGWINDVSINYYKLNPTKEVAFKD